MTNTQKGLKTLCSVAVLALFLLGAQLAHAGDIMPVNGSIGDFVWSDLNTNGIQDSSEPGIDGVTVSLLDDAFNEIAMATTVSGGFYLFSDLAPETYYIKVTPPAGSFFSPMNQGGDDTIDSDFEPTTGISDPVYLDPGENDLTYDAGLTNIPIPAALPLLLTGLAGLGLVRWRRSKA